MKQKRLDQAELGLLKRLSFERDGFRVLMKDFMVDSPLDAEFAINKEEWEDVKKDFLTSNNMLLMAVTELTGDQNAYATFSVDFNEGVIKW